MKELIERLRYPVLCTLDDRLEAADALERLTAELEATKKAVQQNYFRVVEVTAERDALVNSAAQEELYNNSLRDQMTADHTITLLRKELNALRRDALRYRWLRDVGDSTFRPMSTRPGVRSAEQIDAAIDAAMKEQTP